MLKIINFFKNCITLSDGMRLRVKWDYIKTMSTWDQNAVVNVETQENLFWPIRITCIDNKESIFTRKWVNDNLVPKGKFDFETVSKLEEASLSEIEPILPDLFEWTEDVNWPIAPKISEILARFDKAIIPYIIYYLHNPSGLDEYGTYYHLLPKLDKTQLLLIKDELMRIKQYPSSFQSEEGYDKLAESYLKKIEDMDS